MRSAIIMFLLAIGLACVALLAGYGLRALGLDKGVQTVVCTIIICQGIFLVTYKYGIKGR